MRLLIHILGTVGPQLRKANLCLSSGLTLSKLWGLSLGGGGQRGETSLPPPPPFLYPSKVSGSSFPLSPAQSLIAGSPLSGMVNKPLGDINCQQELGA